MIKTVSKLLTGRLGQLSALYMHVAVLLALMFVCSPLGFELLGPGNFCIPHYQNYM